MNAKLLISVATLLCIGGAARADSIPSMPLASHRAAYEISLASTDSNRPPGAQTPIEASGLIAYEFRGSACEGYASNFRQLTQLQRGEGDPVSSDIRAVTFEDADSHSMKFEIDAQNAGGAEPPVSGDATRNDKGGTTVDLRKPSTEKVDIGKDILFPTQHIEAIIAKAKAGAGTMEARVYDGSDSGKKVFATLTVIGKPTTTPSADAKTAEALGKLRHWPVSVSYFDESDKDAPPEYVLSFDLYENGVSGSLKLDYGAFALTAKLTRLEWLPTPTCGK